MKKIFICLIMALVAAVGTINAQVEPAKLFDNTTVTLKAGVATPMDDYGTVSHINTGLEIEKWLNPWLGVSADGNFMIGLDDYNYHTAFDFVNVNALTKFNVINMFTPYTGKRHTFEPLVFTGLGWGHATYDKTNYLMYKAGVDIDFNLGKEKEWAIRLEPAVVWSVDNAFKLNKRNGLVEFNVGAVYRFRNHDGNRNFTTVKRYNEDEVRNLNGLINELREENARVVRENEDLVARLAEEPKVVETVSAVAQFETATIMPKINFYANSACLVETTLGNVYQIADFIKATPDTNYLITGYASIEGDEAYNLQLSENRATALRDKLVELGVNPAQLKVEAKGATEQFSTDCRTMNRVVIVEED